MAIEMNDELVLNRDETVALIRNMICPNLDAIRRRDAFLRDRDDMTYCISEEGIIAECSGINLFDEKQPLYDSQSIVSDRRGGISYVQQSLGYDYSIDCVSSCFSSMKKDDEWRDSSQLTDSFIVQAA